jgi:hypothetical protein
MGVAGRVQPAEARNMIIVGFAAVLLESIEASSSKGYWPPGWGKLANLD